MLQFIQIDIMTFVGEDRLLIDQKLIENSAVEFHHGGSS